MAATWIDLLDPTADEVRENAPMELEELAIERLLAPAEHEDEPRPTMQGHGDYVFGVLLVAVAVPDEDDVFYQEIDLVLTHDTLLTVRKTPQGNRPACDVAIVKETVKPTDSAGMMAYRLVDEIAERYLDLVDALDEEIDELEDKVEDQPAQVTRNRISALRHDLLHIRRTLAPMRDAVRRVIDDVVEVDEGPEVFPHDVEVAFNSTYDKLMRAFDGLELSRDLLASVRDYSQSKIANDQNDVMKRLTVVASLLLPPTFIVGLYGQNFVDIPELRWHWGYGFSWALIIVDARSCSSSGSAASAGSSSVESASHFQPLKVPLRGARGGKAATLLRGQATGRSARADVPSAGPPATPAGRVRLTSQATCYASTGSRSRRTSSASRSRPAPRACRSSGSTSTRTTARPSSR